MATATTRSMTKTKTTTKSKSNSSTAILSLINQIANKYPETNVSIFDLRPLDVRVTVAHQPPGSLFETGLIASPSHTRVRCHARSSRTTG